MDTQPTSTLEEKAVRLLACTAVFWSFFIAAGLLVQTFSNMQEDAYASAYAEANYAAVLAQSNLYREMRMREQPPLPPPQNTALSPEGDTGGGGTSTPPAPGMRALHCPRPSMALQRGGAHNMPGEVQALQQFLAERYQQKTDDLVTGHFGPLTERLMMRFQEEQGLPPVGIVGPMTRAAILRACSTASSTPTTGGNSPQAAPQVLRVVPQSGKAPLTTNISVSAPAGNYLLAFGDGATTTLAIPSVQCVTTPCNPPVQTVVHTYQNVGTYTATLTDSTGATVGSAAIRATRMERTQ